MQVWELMAKLSTARANTEVCVGMHSTLNGDIDSIHISEDGNEVVITGGDVQLINNDGDERNWRLWTNRLPS